MHAVVNHLTLSRPLNDGVFERMQSELMPAARAIEGFHDAYCVRIGDEQIIMVILCETPEALERVHLEVGNPWIGANVRPSVAMADRKVGVVAAHARAGE
jgi:hypothetical protein